MSTRSGRNVTKVERFDPTDKKRNIDNSSEEEDEPKVTKKAKKTAVAAKKAPKRKVSKENADGTPKEKRPLTAYFLFMAEERPILVKEQPDLGAKEVISELGARWKALPEAKKAKFNAAAAKAKAEYVAKKEAAPSADKPKKSKK
ncbi:hypothetical protein DYB28_001974 [Aphanomyces astaci]|uniref:HMG box domain-containing protein n=2 Tax=Aphanomyces astaci TaxID=112090 RepID=A0A397C3V4_APHAT|nr:hypothetical protein AaE_005936 [Aphanomyces astaci]RHY36367.1 hypothetical protein DYB38_010870 [Aphanomyces astaci]RHZ38037.1 hypothetical protein DYB31_000479 [Aphanomyces astaci]RLO04868.1 hypothetical protein DYB28_001974 [Aphanomyces astaci]